MLQNQLKTSEKYNNQPSHNLRERKTKHKEKPQCHLHRMAFTFLPNHINSSHVTLVSSVVTYYITVG